MIKLILMGVGVVVLAVGSVIGTLFLTGAMDEEPDGTEPVVEVVYAPKPVYYYNIQPEFVINFNRKTRPRALMVEVTASSHDEDALATLDTHSPELRNNLLSLMAESDGTSLTTIEGKNELREKIKVALNELLKKHVVSEAIEEIFFIRFVLQ